MAIKNIQELFSEIKSKNCRIKQIREFLAGDDAKTLINQFCNNLSNYEASGLPPLAYAARIGKAEVCQVLVDAGADVNAKSKYSRHTALMYAAWNGHDEIVEFLLSHGADATLVGDDGETILACKQLNSVSNPIIYKRLIEAGADVNARCKEFSHKEGQTPLLRANSYEVVKMLLEAGADPHASDGYDTPLKLISDIEACRLLIQYGADVNARGDEEDWTPLMCAAGFDGTVEKCKLLIEHGADANALSSSGETAFDIARGDGTKPSEIADYLGTVTTLRTVKVEKPYNPAEDPELSSKFVSAARKGDLKTVQKLFEQGADINSSNRSQYKPAILWAAENGHVDVCKFIFSKGPLLRHCTDMFNYMARLGESDFLAQMLKCGPLHSNCLGAEVAIVEFHANYSLDGKTALIEAAERGDEATCKFLLEEADASVNAHSDWGLNSLAYAAQNGHASICTLLISHGARMISKANGMTAHSALGCAAENGHDDVCELLISAGADVNPEISEKFFPLMLAVKNGHVSTSKLLLEHGANIHIKYWDKNLLSIANESRSPNSDLVVLIEEHLSRSVPAPDPFSIDQLKCADSLSVYSIFSQDVPYIDPNLSYPDKSLFNEVRNFKVRSVSSLIKAGAVPNSIDPNGETPLFTAIRSFDFKTNSSIISVINLLIDAGADVNAIGYQGLPLLICALVEYGKEEAALRLISAGAKVDVSHPRYGSSMYAAGASIEAMKALLSAGASVDGLGPNLFSNLPDEWTALMKLCSGYGASNAEIKWLLEVGANPNARDHLGWTPLLIASWKREIEFVKALVTHGADIHAVNSDGMNALDLAMASRDLDLFNKKKNARNFEVDKLEIVDYLSNELGLKKAMEAI